MTTSLRLLFTCSLFSLPLVACGDDGGNTDSNSTQVATDTDATSPTGTETGTTTTTGTTEEPTTEEPTSTSTTTSTTEPETSTTEPPGTLTTEEPGTSTTEPGTSTTEMTTTTTTTGDGLSWESDVFPEVVQGNCGCHQQGSGGLTMTGPADSYTNLVDADSSEAAGFKRVAPGDPGASYLVAKLKGVHLEAPFNGSGKQMPLGGAPLAADKIALVEQWITEGAAP